MRIVLAALPSVGLVPHRRRCTNWQKRLTTSSVNSAVVLQYSCHRSIPSAWLSTVSQRHHLPLLHAWPSTGPYHHHLIVTSIPPHITTPHHHLTSPPHITPSHHTAHGAPHLSHTPHRACTPRIHTTPRTFTCTEAVIMLSACYTHHPYLSSPQSQRSHRSARR